MNFNIQVAAIIGVRMNSSRLYGKSMKLIGDKPVIGHTIERLRSIEEVHYIVLAIPATKENWIVREYADEVGVDVFLDWRGEEEDVLGRTLRAAREVYAEHVIRLSGDMPFIYTQNMDRIINYHREVRADLTYVEKLPLGAFSEILPVYALQRAYDYDEKYHNPMVTLCMKEHPEDFKIEVFTPPKELQRPELRLTVDTQSDLDVMNILYESLPKPLTIVEAIRFLDDNPELKAKNMNVPYSKEARIWG